jgi:hypothetical protein
VVVALGAVALGHARLAAQQASPSPPGSSSVETRPTPSAAPARGDEIVAKIGDRVITLREIEDKLRMYPDSVRERVLKANNLRTFVKGLVVKELAAREAERLGIDKEPRVRERLEETRQDVLYNALSGKLLETISVTEAEMEAYFQAHKSEFGGKEYKDVKPQVAQRLRDMKSRAVYEAFQRDAEARWPVTLNEAALQKVTVSKGHSAKEIEKAIEEAERRMGPLPEETKKMWREGTAPVAPVARPKTTP